MAMVAELLFGAALAALLISQRTKAPPVTPTNASAPIEHIIRSACARHNVPPEVALAFAWLESRFNPDAEGDKNWPWRNGGALYKAHVVGSPRLEKNPARNDPGAWHSYGLFQLLAPYWAPPDKHPSTLLDPVTNADIGVRYIGQLLRKHNGDIVATRLAYTGCGADGSRCPPAKVAEIKAKLSEALRKFRQPNS